MKLKGFLHRPHPFIFNRFSVLVPAVITFLVLVVFKPFGMFDYTVGQVFSWGSFFAFLVGIAIYSCVSLLQFVSGEGLKDRWTVKHEVLLIFVVLGVISLLLFAFFFFMNTEMNPVQLFVKVVLRTLVISFFPVLILVLYEQYHYQKRRTVQAEQLTKELLSQKKSNSLRGSTTDAAKITLPGENNKVALQLSSSDVLFVRSDGNYLEVFYLKNAKVEKELIRNTLKSLEKELTPPDFFRCHNRFLIGLMHVQKVEGNARNLEISLANIKEKIPVSRTKSAELLKRFNGEI
jgi:hypothetical protein